LERSSGNMVPANEELRDQMKFNRIIGFMILAAVVYGVLQAYGLLPEGTPRLFPPRGGSPAA
jgi:hypothetical protein